MSASGINKEKQTALKTAFHYLVVTLACILFGAVYEMNSHGVYSFFMLYAFAVPLTGGVLPFLCVALGYMKKRPDRRVGGLWHAGMATLTVGCIIRGMLDIYGTTNGISAVYWYAGGGMTAAALILFWLKRPPASGVRLH